MQLGIPTLNGSPPCEQKQNNSLPDQYHDQAALSSCKEELLGSGFASDINIQISGQKLDNSNSYDSHQDQNNNLSNLPDEGSNFTYNSPSVLGCQNQLKPSSNLIEPHGMRMSTDQMNCHLSTPPQMSNSNTATTFIPDTYTVPDTAQFQAANMRPETHPNTVVSHVPEMHPSLYSSYGATSTCNTFSHDQSSLVGNSVPAPQYHPQDYNNVAYPVHHDRPEQEGKNVCNLIHFVCNFCHYYHNIEHWTIFTQSEIN